MYLESQDQLRQVEWGRSYLWDIKFDDPDHPINDPLFSKWFPAITVEEPLAMVKSFDFEAYSSTYSVPRSTDKLMLSITFHDNDQRVLEKWLKAWMFDIHNGQYTKTLQESLRLLRISKLDLHKEEVNNTAYFVFPEGQLVFAGGSDSTPTQFSLTFVICGKKDSYSEQGDAKETIYPWGLS